MMADGGERSVRRRRFRKRDGGVAPEAKSPGGPDIGAAELGLGAQALLLELREGQHEILCRPQCVADRLVLVRQGVEKGQRQGAAGARVGARGRANDANRAALEERLRLGLLQGQAALQEYERGLERLGPLVDAVVLDQRAVMPFPEENGL